MQIPPYKIMRNKFDRAFLDFDYNFYEETIAGRQKNNSGNYKASCLIKEIALLSGFFVHEKVRAKMSYLDASYCAFLGWQISYDQMLSSHNGIKIERRIKKFSRNAHKTIKRSAGVILELEEIAWVIFCCAMIREKFYTEFNYCLKAFMSEPGDEQDLIRVLYERKA